MDDLAGPLRAIWDWLSTDRMAKLTFIGGGVATISAALWKIYEHRSKKKNGGITAISGGIAFSGNVSGTTTSASSAVLAGNVTIGGIGITGITLEQHEASLKRKENEVRDELLKVNAEDKEKNALLKKELADIQRKLIDAESALADYKEAYKTINDLKREVLPEQIKQAQDALTRGQTGDAEKLFTQVLPRDTEDAAEATLSVANSLHNLAFMYQMQGQYDKAEPLYQRSLAIREKTLGPDHADVAASLNNLAELYRAQGQYDRAEQLYQRLLQ